MGTTPSANYDRSAKEWVRQVRFAVAAIVVSFLAMPLLAPAAQALQQGPMLVLEDSVVLRETDDHTIGEPAGLVVSSDGSFFVSDRFSQRVLHFESDGTFLRAFGRAGRGPGEFTYIGPVGFVADGKVGFLDLRPLAIKVFEVKTGRYVDQTVLPADQTVFPMSFSIVNDTVWIAGRDKNTWLAVGAVSVADLVTASSNAVIALDRVAVPSIYQGNQPENQIVTGLLPTTTIAVGNDDLVVGFEASQFVLRTDRAGVVLDTLVFPAARRRGLPDESDWARFVSEATGIREFVGSVSSLMAVSRDDAGRVYAVHSDYEYGAARPGAGWDARAKLFVSSMRKDGSEACPDTQVPTSDVGAAKVIFLGDRLFVADQRILDSQNAQTVVRHFRINSVDCAGPD